MVDEPPEPDAFMVRAAAGDLAAWGALLASHQPKLTRMVGFRMDPRLRGRVDPADVVQDAFVEASLHRADYFRTPASPDDVPPPEVGVSPFAPAPAPPPLFLWLRGVVGNKLLELHRHHLGTRMRDAKRELPLDAPPRAAGDTSAALCAHLTAGLTRPSVAAVRGEVRTRLTAALDAMDPTDREVLALRHFEQLTSAEAAQVLGIQERAAAKRYLRALERLRKILSEMPGGLTELRP
jgi:RNA polymerase sigma-70 factor (ECF subfamily)